MHDKRSTKALKVQYEMRSLLRALPLGLRFGTHNYRGNAPESGCQHARLSLPSYPRTSPCLPAEAASPGHSNPEGSPVLTETACIILACGNDMRPLQDTAVLQHAAPCAQHRSGDALEADVTRVAPQCYTHLVTSKILATTRCSRLQRLLTWLCISANPCRIV